MAERTFFIFIFSLKVSKQTKWSIFLLSVESKFTFGLVFPGTKGMGPGSDPFTSCKAVNSQCGQRSYK